MLFVLRKLGYVLPIRFRVFQFPWFDNPDLNLIYHSTLTSPPMTKKIMTSRDVVFEEKRKWDWDKSYEQQVLVDLEWGESEDDEVIVDPSDNEDEDAVVGEDVAADDENAMVSPSSSSSEEA